MSVCRMPPPTGDPVLDAWANDVTKEINCTIFPLISDVASNGGSSGADGNMTLFLYKRTTTASVPATPTSVTYNYVNVDNTTLTANLGWTAEIPSNSGGKYLWVTFRYVSAKAGSINNANSWDTPAVLAQDGDQGTTGDTGETGDTGATGDPAPRSTTRKLYRAATSLPSPPTATITWATSALSSITSGWSETAPTQVASSTTYVYTSYIVFSDATGASTTSTSTGGTSVQSTSFSGLVTFASGDFNVDGNAITTIDGGNIAAGSLTVTNADIQNLTVQRIKIASSAVSDLRQVFGGITNFAQNSSWATLHSITIPYVVGVPIFYSTGLIYIETFNNLIPNNGSTFTLMTRVISSPVTTWVFGQVRTNVYKRNLPGLAHGGQNQLTINDVMTPTYYADASATITLNFQYLAFGRTSTNSDLLRGLYRYRSHFYVQSVVK